MTKEAQERLESSAASFRGRVGADFEARDMERKEAKAREILVELDEKRGVKVSVCSMNLLRQRVLI